MLTDDEKLPANPLGFEKGGNPSGAAWSSRGGWEILLKLSREGS
jgi:hypothetical protein